MVRVRVRVRIGLDVGLGFGLGLAPTLSSARRPLTGGIRNTKAQLPDTRSGAAAGAWREGGGLGVRVSPG
jgi:hypothetical protein